MGGVSSTQASLANHTGQVTCQSKQGRSLAGSCPQVWLWRGAGSSGFLCSGAVAPAGPWWTESFGNLENDDMVSEGMLSPSVDRLCSILLGNGWEPAAKFLVLLSPTWSLLSHQPRGRFLNNIALWLNLLKVLGTGSCVYKHLSSQLLQACCIH